MKVSAKVDYAVRISHPARKHCHFVRHCHPARKRRIHKFSNFPIYGSCAFAQDDSAVQDGRGIKYNFIILTFVSLILILFSGASISGDLYPFQSKQKQVQFNQLIEQLRCLVCQNENLASSNAPLASDLRKQIYTMIKQGKNSKEIINYLVDRYGEFILFKPPLNDETYFLWFSPFVLIIIGFFILYRMAKPK